jgi:hypothetical protein
MITLHFVFVLHYRLWIDSRKLKIILKNNYYYTSKYSYNKKNNWAHLRNEWFFLAVEVGPKYERAIAHGSTTERRSQEGSSKLFFSLPPGPILVIADITTNQPEENSADSSSFLKKQSSCPWVVKITTMQWNHHSQLYLVCFTQNMRENHRTQLAFLRFTLIIAIKSTVDICLRNIVLQS